MTVCNEENAYDLNMAMSSAGRWISFIGYALRLVASLSVTAYLYRTREKRHFPQYIKLQLALVSAEYFIALCCQTWKLIVYSQGGIEDAESGTIYIQVTYPLNNLTSLMYLYYNWLYVS